MRTRNVIRNILARWLGTIVLAAIQFLSRIVFIRYFSDDLMGLSSLLTSVITMLSLLELGVGNAIYYSLYEPLQRKDEEQVGAIMQMYQKVYSGIGVAVFILGIILIPFLDFFVTTDLPDKTVLTAYGILLADTSLSYFLAYRRNIYNADQREFVCSNNDTFFNVATIVLQILATVLTGNYYLYLISKVLCTIGGNLRIYLKSQKDYPSIRKKTNYRLSKAYMSRFMENVKALCISNLSTYLVFGTDNLLLSRYVSLSSVFLYSNYTLIINFVNRIFHNIFDSFRASIGNYMITESKEKVYALFNEVFFINYLITSFTTVSLFLCFNNTITIWLGEEYTFGIACVAVLCLNNYLRHIQSTSTVFRQAAGLYNPYPFYRYWSLVDGIVNLAASLLLIAVLENKVLGVFLGTTISTAVVFTLSSVHALFKYYFGIELLFKHVKKFVIYLMLMVAYCSIGKSLCDCFAGENTIIRLLISMLVSVLLPNVLNLVLFCRTPEFGRLLARVNKMRQRQ